VTVDPVRQRILEGTFACVARRGLARTTVEDAAREAGVARATVYRHFPGGKEQLLSDVIAWETARFFHRLAVAVEGTGDFTGLLEEGLRYAHRAVADHTVLQQVLRTEPGRLLPTLTIESNRIRQQIRAFLVPHLLAEPRLRPGLSAEEASEYVSRMLLSWIEAPGRWDLDDPQQVAQLVRTVFLAGVLVAG